MKEELESRTSKGRRADVVQSSNPITRKQSPTIKGNSGRSFCRRISSGKSSAERDFVGGRAILLSKNANDWTHEEMKKKWVRRHKKTRGARTYHRRVNMLEVSSPSSQESDSTKRNRETPGLDENIEHRNLTQTWAVSEEMTCSNPHSTKTGRWSICVSRRLSARSAKKSAS